MEEELTRLTELLQKALALYTIDREMAITNYNMLKNQYENILSTTVEMSEEGKVEKELNVAMKLVFESGNRLDSVIQTVSKVITTQLNSESRERTAALLSGIDPTGKKIIDKPIDIGKLLVEANKKDEEE